MSVTAVPLQPVKRRYLVWLWAGIALAIVAAAALAWAGTRDPIATYLSSNASRAGVVTTDSGLQYEVLEKGNGPTPTDDDVTLVNYTGTLPDGSTFDQSQQPTPMSPRQVVPGFGEALKLMPRGSKYRFWIKPELGYASPRPEGAPALEGKAAELAKQVLIFDVEMVDFIPEAELRRLQMQQMMQGGGAPGAPGAVPPPGGR